MNNAVSVGKSWFDTLKEQLSFDSLAKRFDLSKDKMITLLFYLGAGFLAGFLMKKYFKYLIVLGLIILGIYLLQTNGIMTITVNWTRMYEVFGIKDIPQVSESTLSMVWEWIKANMALSISFFVGFFIGWKVS